MRKLKIQIQNVNYTIQLSKLPNNAELLFTYNGGKFVSYYFFNNGVLLFSGNDYKPAPSHNVDDVDSFVSLLGFLTLRPGDTDADYFKNYTSEQLAYCDSHECEELRLMVNDFECGETEYETIAREYFTQRLSS